MEYRQGVFREGPYVVIVSVDNGRWHLSVSHHNHIPSYEILKQVRYKYLPDEVTMAQLFPPKAEFVNLHPNCLHLWQVGITAELPSFLYESDPNVIKTGVHGDTNVTDEWSAWLQKQL